MLNGFSFGQYFPGESALHRMDARVKLLLTIGMIVALFVAGGAVPMALLVALTLLLFIGSHIPLTVLWRSVRGILPLVIFMSLLNIFYIKGPTVLAQFWIFTITLEGVWRAIFLAVRIILLIVVTSLLTYTTSPIDLTDGLERLLSPLKKIHLPVHDLAMIMTIALRFIPTLIEETDKIMSAQKARGADIDSGSLVRRVRATIPILVPLFVSAVRRATDLAVAMDCRCYHGGEGRTRLKQMKLHRVDLFGVLGYACILAAVIGLNFLPFGVV